MDKEKIKVEPIPVKPEFEQTIDLVVSDIVRFFGGTEFQKETIRELVKTAVVFERMSANELDMKMLRKRHRVPEALFLKRRR